MKILISFIFAFSTLFATDYFAVIQAVNTYNVKASVSGIITYTNDKVEGNTAKNEVIIRFDSKLDKLELVLNQGKLKSLQEILKIEKSTLATFNRVSSKSKIDRDNQKVKVLNTSTGVSDLSIRIATLKDRISKKELKENNLYISEILVKRGEYANPGTPLYTALDLSKAKLEIYIPIGKVDEYLSKSIYLDGKETKLKINKVYKVADKKYLSSYKCEIIIEDIETFSKIIKVSFK
jgi:multidrug resistance efflux pump